MSEAPIVEPPPRAASAEQASRDLIKRIVDLAVKHDDGQGLSWLFAEEHELPVELLAIAACAIADHASREQLDELVGRVVGLEEGYAACDAIDAAESALVKLGVSASDAEVIVSEARERATAHGAVQ